MTRDDQDLFEQPAEIVREYGPFPGVARVNGVTYDGAHVWLAAGDHLHALDPETGALARTLAVASHAGTAFDGRYLYQLDAGRIHRVDPADGRVLSSIAAPVADGCAGLAWADGVLWVGCYTEHRIYQVDPATGAVLRTLASDRFVTGVTWVDGELWHGSDGAIRCVDPATGAVQAQLDLPAGVRISGLESDGRDLLFCGGGETGTIRAVRRPRRRGHR